MSTTPWRQPALGLLTAVLTVLAVLASGVPVAGAASTGPRGHRHQSVSVTVLPGVRQSGATPAPSRAALTVVAATVRPHAHGRPVVLQKRHHHTWRNVQRSRTAGRGKVAFMVPAPRHGRRASYRVVALRWRGHRGVHSRPAVDRWGAPDFVDEFDGTALSDAWEHRISFYNPWGGRACSKGDPRAVAVSSGVLRLSSMPDPDARSRCPVKDKAGRPLGRFPYRLNGHISTQHSADFLYGVAAARMRFPKSLGQHAAFWLQPRGLLDTGTTPWGDEVDVVEWYGARGRNTVMSSAVHEPMPDGSKRQIGGMIPRPDRFLATRSDSWWDSYHVFSVEWTRSRYVFRIAGHEVWRTHQGVSHVPEFLILSMLSSDFELPDVGTDPTPRTAEVDWVAFWQGRV